MNTLDYALAYARLGFSVVPIKPDGSKGPAVVSWSPFQSRIASPDEIRQWYVATPNAGVGIIGGMVSGGLEILDFDDPAAWKEFLDLCEVTMPGQLSTLPLAATPKGGVHLYLRGRSEIKGNRKLARASDKHVLVETRGEGGYVVAPGSPPACHPTGGIYTWMQAPEGIVL